MKTETARWPLAPTTPRRLELNLPWHRYVGYGSLALAALVPFAMLTLAGAWAISAGFVAELAASSWCVSFVLLAAAVDARGWRAVSLAAGGFAVMALSIMAWFVAPEFGVMAAGLGGAWLSLGTAEALLRLLREPC